MPIKSLNCPNCGAPLPDPAGRVTLICRHCQTLLYVSDLASPADPAAAPGQGQAAASQPEGAGTQPPRLAAADLAEIRQLLADGRKIQAIHFYRERTGLGLKEAESAIDAIEAGLAAEGRSAPAPPRQALPEHLSAVRQLLRDGQRMQAIQVFRQATGASLAQAVDAIDLLEKSRGQIDVSTQGAVDLSRVQQLLREGRKIHAIAAYRDQTGVGLKEAKEAVEAIAAATSGVPASLAQPKPLTERLGCLGMALGLVVVFLAFSGGCGAVAKNTGLYRCAMSELRNHPGLIEQLGQPVRAGALVFVGGFSYESSFDGASQTAMEFYTPASGPKGRGLLSVSAAGDSEGEAGMRSRLLIGGHWVTVSNWRGLTCP